jgi:hypothetical protein
MSEMREPIDTELEAECGELVDFGNIVAQANNATQVGVVVGGGTSGITGDNPDNASVGSVRDARCAVCDGKFGLVRHYSWRTHLCSKKCVDLFRARRAGDRKWLSWLRIALDQAPENRARA